MSPIALAIIALLLGTTSVFAEPVVPVRLNGAPTNRVNIAVLGDGYAAADQHKFAAIVDAFVNYLFLQPPFTEYASYFNVYRIDVTSNDSGVDHPEWQQLKDTALGTSYSCGGVQRYICFDQRAVDTVIARSALPADLDLILIFVNDMEYGGSGGRYAVSSADGGGIATMVHEAGHTFGLLADEYTDGSQNNCRGTREPSYANATRQTERDSIKWRHWIADTTAIPTTTLAPATPGLFKGSHHCIDVLFRPTHDSKMRTTAKPFEQVNSEQLIRRFYNFVSPIDAVAPASANLQFRRGQPAAFSVQHPQPPGHDLSIAWTLDDQPIGSGDSVTLDTATLTPGRHVIQVTVRDPTPLVRHDPDEALVERFAWTVEILP
jgi:hypothetical protein